MDSATEAQAELAAAQVRLLIDIAEAVINMAPPDDQKRVAQALARLKDAGWRVLS